MAMSASDRVRRCREVKKMVQREEEAIVHNVLGEKTIVDFDEFIEQSLEINDIGANNENINDDDDEDINDDDNEYVDNDDVENANKHQPLKEQLRSWAIHHNITHRALSDLLRVLIVFGYLTFLPKSSKTLLKTPANIDISPSVAGGKFWYNGVANCLRSSLLNIKNPVTLQLKFNIDGIPLFNSSRTEFWPILMSISG